MGRGIGVGHAAVVVLQGATVQQLMQAFQKKLEEICRKESRTRHLSWYG